MFTNCNGCPFDGTSKKIPDILSLNNNKRILIIGEAPHTEEIEKGKPFVGASGLLLNRLLTFVGLSREDVSIGNVIKCFKPDNTPASVIASVLKFCRPHIEQTIIQTKPELIIVLGKVAYQSLFGKRDAINNHIGKFYNLPEFDTVAFITVHPSYVLRGGCHQDFPFIDESLMSYRERLMFNSFKLLKEYLTDGHVSSLLQKAVYRKLSDKDLLTLVESAKRFAYDIEWHPETGQILGISFANDKGMIGFYNNMNLHTLKYVFSKDTTKIVANRSADESKLREIGITIKGKTHDVFLLAHLLDENMPNIKLSELSRIYLNIPLDDKKSTREKITTLSEQELIEYGCRDSDITLKLFNVLAPRLKKDEKLLRYYGRFIMPISEMLSEMSSYSFKIDTKKLKENDAIMRSELSRIHNELISELPDRLKKKYSDNLSLTRSALIRDFLFTKAGLNFKPIKFTQKTNEPTVSIDHIKHFDHPWIAKYLEYNKLETLHSRYILPLYKILDNDGRIKIQTFLYRTVSGRVVSNPPIQTIPQRGKYVDLIRELYTVEDGYLMGARDLSQSEVRIMAWQANEKNMLNVFRNKGDIHKFVASSILRIPESEVTKEDRQKAKSFVFGFLYGMQAESFVEYALDEYGIKYSLEEAVEFRERFFNLFPSILGYHNAIKMFLRKHGYVRSPLGRIRRLPSIRSMSYSEKLKAERQAINFPIQSFSSDIGLIAMYLFWLETKKDPRLRNVKLMWFIHDAIFFQAPENVMDYAMKKLKSCMEYKTYDYVRNHFKFNINYPIASEGKIGKSWASLNEIKD